MKFKFEDVRPEFVGSEAYLVPNENLAVLRDLADRQNFKRVGSICSAGEVPLTVLLPRAEQLVAVDHNYGSLGYGMAKAALLEAYSGGDIINACKGNEAAFRAMLKEVVKDIEPKTLQLTETTINSTYFSSLRIIWGKMDPARLDAARERIGEVTFIHGDLRDLENYGKFDFVYLSNALEHRPYDGRTYYDDPTASKKGLGFHSFEKLTGRAGVLLFSKACSDDASMKKLLPKPWQFKEATHRKYPYTGFPHQDGELSWTYTVAGKETPAEAPIS